MIDMSFFAFETPAESARSFFSSTCLSLKKSRGGVRACVFYALSDISRVCLAVCRSRCLARSRARVITFLCLDFAGLSCVFTAAAVCVARVCPVPLRLAALPVPLIHSK
jgi:hypothetical protein